MIIFHALAYSCWWYVTLAKKWGYEEKWKLVTWLIKRSGSHLCFPHELMGTCMEKRGGGGVHVVQNQQECNTDLKFTNFLKTFSCTFNTKLRTLTWENCSYISYWSWNCLFYMVRQAILWEGLEQAVPSLQLTWDHEYCSGLGNWHQNFLLLYTVWCIEY